MNNERNEISSTYRSARRNTSILSGIGIAWAAAQFEIKTISLGAFGGVDLQGASIPVILAILCIYSLARSTIEYMMQTKTIRRWKLAQLDYRITLYLARLSLIILAASVIGRTSEMVMYIAGSSVLAFFCYFVLVGIMMFVTMPTRMLIRQLSGRISAANAAIEAFAWAALIVGLLYIGTIVLTGLSIIQPFKFLGQEYSEIGGLPLAIFASVSLVILFSFFFDSRFFNMVFAFEPVMIEKKYIDEQGREIFSIEPNPDHPEYEKHKNQSALKYTKVTGEKKNIQTSKTCQQNEDTTKIEE